MVYYILALGLILAVSITGLALKDVRLHGVNLGISLVFLILWLAKALH
jgi:hypothetical protein